MTPSTMPKCPNHGSFLEGIERPLPRKGVGKCPISGANFDFEAESEASSTKLRLDTNGNILKEAGWKVSGDD